MLWLVPMADSWSSRLISYRWRSRTAKGWVAVRCDDLKRLIDERDQLAGACERLEVEGDRLRAEIYDRELALTRHAPVWEKETA